MNYNQPYMGAYQNPMMQQPYMYPGQCPMHQYPMMQQPMQYPMATNPMMQYPMATNPMMQQPMATSPMMQQPMVQPQVPAQQNPFQMFRNKR